MKIKVWCSPKERRLLAHFITNTHALDCLKPSEAYKYAVEIAFMNNMQGNEVEALRKVVKRSNETVHWRSGIHEFIEGLHF